MTYKEEEIIYILTTKDVDDVARELHIPRPSKSQYQAVRRSVERSFAYGPNNWHEAIGVALKAGIGIPSSEK